MEKHKGGGNTSLHSAKKVKNDEFYTQLPDIENELRHYKNQLKGKVIFCNCDDPAVSGFVRYFFLNFRRLGLQRLIAACYRNTGIDSFADNSAEYSCWFDYQPSMRKRPDDEKPDFRSLRAKRFQKDGDFRSPECIELLKQADVVVTNPPFSLFREYVAQLMEYKKVFLIIGNKNAITYREMFKLIKENRLWLGYTSPQEFILSDGTASKQVQGLCRWFTNLDVSIHNEELPLYKTYNPGEYPKYDNYDAIEVSKVTDIPMDYDGYMGVPITFLDKHNPNQFEIIKFRKGVDDRDLSINGKCPYFRIIIRKKK